MGSRGNQYLTSRKAQAHACCSNFFFFYKTFSVISTPIQPSLFQCLLIRIVVLMTITQVTFTETLVLLSLLCDVFKLRPPAPTPGRCRQHVR